MPVGWRGPGRCDRMRRMELIVISLGALSKNPLWNERTPVRSSHATTTLLRSGDANVLVDPSLPGEVLAARLGERAGVDAGAVTHVFLTNWRPVHRRALERFSKAVWWMHEAEIDAATAALDQAEEQAAHQESRELEALIKKERVVLHRMQAAPEELAENLQLYPLPGYTPGQCGLIVTEPTLTTVIAGDAVPTAGHFAAGQVFPDCWDLEKAKESLLELLEVADVIVPGHDNLFVARRSV
jgi:glyoxylase-like metal-dependent hydrolase (beta-lactamase superfamily II)